MVCLPACPFVFLEKSLRDQCWCNVSMYFRIAPSGAALCCLTPVCEVHYIHTEAAEGFVFLVSHQQQQQDTHTHTLHQISLSWIATFISAVPSFCVFFYFVAVNFHCGLFQLQAVVCSVPNTAFGICSTLPKCLQFLRNMLSMC